jgi:hypothetical protein
LPFKFNLQRYSLEERGVPADPSTGDLSLGRLDALEAGGCTS